MKNDKSSKSKKTEDQPAAKKPPAVTVGAPLFDGPHRGTSIEVTAAEWIGPKEAAEMLTHANPNNRTISPATVDGYAEEMGRGLWQCTHQGIAIGDDGVLYDGHHRLHAVVKSGATVLMLVTRGVSKSKLDAIDRGRVRKAYEIVKMVDGTEDKVIVRGGLMVAWALSKKGSLLPQWGATRDAPHDLREARAEHFGPVTEICEAMEYKRDRLAHAPVVGSLAICHRTHAAMAVQFAKSLRSGANLSEVSPVLALRTHILSNYIASGAVARDDLTMRVFGAFDAFVRGKPLKQAKPNRTARARYLAPWRPDDGAEEGED